MVEDEAQTNKKIKNFQVTYCRESIGNYSYHIIQYKEKTYDHSRIFTEDDLVDGRYIVLQRGKKNYYLLIAE